MGNEKWVVSISEEYWSNEDEFNSKEDAIKNANKVLSLEQGDSFFVGVKVPFKLYMPDYDRFIDDIFDTNEDQLSDDWSETWQNSLYKNKKVKEFFNEKMKEMRTFILEETKPEFYTVEKIEMAVHGVKNE